MFLLNRSFSFYSMYILTEERPFIGKKVGRLNRKEVRSRCLIWTVITVLTNYARFQRSMLEWILKKCLKNTGGMAVEAFPSLTYILPKSFGIFFLHNLVHQTLQFFLIGANFRPKIPFQFHRIRNMQSVHEFCILASTRALQPQNFHTRKSEQIR